jgi:hypothetical protein
MAQEIKIVTAVLALIRGETTASAVAEEFGVREFEVHTWKDIFQVAGVVALMTELKGGPGHGHPEPRHRDGGGLTEPTTSTTTRHPHHGRGLGQPTTSTTTPHPHHGRGLGQPTTTTTTTPPKKTRGRRPAR